MNLRALSIRITLLAMMLAGMLLVALATAPAGTPFGAGSAQAEEAAHSEEGGSAGGHEEESDPGAALVGEFAQVPLAPWLEFKLGPIDLSITKAVVYLWMAALILCGFAVWQAKRMQAKPNRKQTVTEVLYTAAHDQIAGSTLGNRVFSTFFPYVATLFLFIWINNLISFIPLPFGEHAAWGFRDLGIYAATSNINVTLALTLMTVVLTHFVGVKFNGPIGYLKGWAPHGVAGPLAVALWLIHALGEFVKIISLSVRLFANMLTGHLLIGVMFTIIFVTGNVFVGGLTVPVALAFFLFEVVLVAVLQAFIFAVLSGVYIGSAAEGSH